MTFPIFVGKKTYILQVQGSAPTLNSVFRYFELNTLICLKSVALV